jgi:3-phenylpropionate/trans-cinnamate dioxygenase ferredoxin subunit
MTEEWLTLGKAVEVGPGEHQVYQTPAGPVIIINWAHEFYGLEDRCTHDGGNLSDGWLENAQLVCPRHGAHFSIKTGEALTPPAYEGVNTYPVKIDEGYIKIKL